MNSYAICEHDVIVNVIVAESMDIARALIGEDREIVESVDNLIGIGWTRLDGQWRPPQPYASWTWDSQTSAWVAPIPEPSSDFYYWDEDSVSWVIYEREIAILDS